MDGFALASLAMVRYQVIKHYAVFCGYKQPSNMSTDTVCTTYLTRHTEDKSAHKVVYYCSFFTGSCLEGLRDSRELFQNYTRLAVGCVNAVG